MLTEKETAYRMVLYYLLCTDYHQWVLANSHHFSTTMYINKVFFKKKKNMNNSTVDSDKEYIRIYLVEFVCLFHTFSVTTKL